VSPVDSTGSHLDKERTMTVSIEQLEKALLNTERCIRELGMSIMGAVENGDVYPHLGHLMHGYFVNRARVESENPVAVKAMDAVRRISTYSPEGALLAISEALAILRSDGEERVGDLLHHVTRLATVLGKERARRHIEEALALVPG
jgi:hypothetical protein